MCVVAFCTCLLLLSFSPSPVVAFQPFSNQGVPPTLPGVWVGQAYGPDYRWSAGGVITEDGSYLFKAKGGNYANGTYTSWQWKEDGKNREYYATVLRVVHDENGSIAMDTVCEYGYVFGIVWTGYQSRENCPPAAGETQTGWRFGKVPVGWSGERKEAASSEDAGHEGASIGDGANEGAFGGNGANEGVSSEDGAGVDEGFDDGVAADGSGADRLAEAMRVKQSENEAGAARGESSTDDVSVLYGEEAAGGEGRKALGEARKVVRAKGVGRRQGAAIRQGQQA